MHTLNVLPDSSIVSMTELRSSTEPSTLSNECRRKGEASQCSAVGPDAAQLACSQYAPASALDDAQLLQQGLLHGVLSGHVHHGLSPSQDIIDSRLPI